MHTTATEMPWLEYTPPGAVQAETAVLDSFPFCIGRSDTADLRIDSTRVSRKHAIVDRAAEGYCVRDNGSTNGTFLNGQRIDEAPLEDGDMLVIADVEFSFFSGAAATPEQTATLVMPQAAQRAVGPGVVRDVIRGVRRLHEMLTHCAVENLFQPIVDMQERQVVGYEAMRDDNRSTLGAPASERSLWATECKLTGRLHQLYRMVAVEETAHRLSEARLFLKLDPAEIGTADLAETLGRLQAAFSGQQGLVVAVPDSAVCNTHHFTQFVQRLRQLGISLAFDGFASGKAQVMELREFPPDFIKLATSFVHGIGGSDARQQQLESVLRAAETIDCQVIAVGVTTEEEAAACLQYGCHLAQGDLFGRPQSIQSVTAAPKHSALDSTSKSKNV